MKTRMYELKQFLKFNAVGLLNTAVDYLVFALLTEILYLPDTPAKLISYSCGILNSYVLNTAWTFKRERKRTPSEVLGFVLVNIVSLGAALAVLYVSRKLLHIETALFRNLIATPISMLINFFGNKLFVFRPK
ncbi:MAG TPA: GtrA family protein [Clostridia bacterium]|nr:GtrA family protein [Clostridia bacterium]HOR12798.1 GtrA family protein [Clostridia bacterium]